MKKKTFVLALSLCLLVCCTAGATIAWLTDMTDPVENKFTASDINITLKETTTDFKMIPGHTINKNPEVTVEAFSEACLVFVKLEKSANYDQFLAQYEMAEGWTQLKDNSGQVVEGVFVRAVEKRGNDQSFAVLKDNKVTVLYTVTKANMNALTEDTYPTLTITAYACQQNYTNNTAFDVAAAWGQVSGAQTEVTSTP